jgi:ATP-binding cassette subfamily B protein
MKDLVRFTRLYMVRYWHWYLAGIITIAATNWLTVTVPLYLADGIDILAEGGSIDEVTPIAITIALMGAALAIIRTASRLFFFIPGRLVEADVKHDVFATLLKQQREFLSQWPPADIISRASNDIHLLRMLAGFSVMQAFNTLFAVTMVSIQMVRISSDLTLAMLPALFIGLGLTQFFIRAMFKLVKAVQEQLSDLSDHILSSYQGVATIQGFVALSSFTKQFDEKNNRYLKTSLKRANIRTVIAPILTLTASVNLFLLLYLGGNMAIEGSLTVGRFVAMITLVGTVIQPLRSMSFLFALFKEAQSSIERVFEVMLPKPDRPDLPNPEMPPTTPPTIEVKALNFSYPGESENPFGLQNIDLTIPSGSTLGIFGRTGSGKSTLLALLARVYNPPKGSISIDGIDITKIDLDAWRSEMTLVPQTAFLFSESLKDNVMLASNDEAQFTRAIADASLTQDLTSLANGVDTLVGEEGLTLSGGQRQRVAIARALMRKPNLLLLDDVLSAVDHETEHQLIDAFHARGGATKVIVSHRTSALQRADNIVVLDEGALVDQGTHSELISRPGIYQDAWSAQ